MRKAQEILEVVPMSRSELDRVYDWLEDHEYWVAVSEFEEEFPEVELEETRGVTKMVKDGKEMIPRRDIRRLVG